jgi:hypothetical protein
MSQSARRAPPWTLSICNDALDADAGDVPVCEVSSFPLHDVSKAISMCLQQEALASLPSQTRKSQGDMDLKALDDTYASLLQQDLAMDPEETDLELRGFGKRHSHMIALQKKTIALAKKQQGNAANPDQEYRRRLVTQPCCSAG